MQQAAPLLFDFLVRTDSPSTGCSFSDYWALYSYIRKAKPRCVLELGSGVSTMVIAYALCENQQKGDEPAQFVSIDESEDYLAATRQLLVGPFNEEVQLLHSSSVEKRWGPFVGRGYQTIPDLPYDFVFVDGPQYERETSFDVDLLELVSKSSTPITAMVDSRAGSCIIYSLYLKPKFSFDRFQNIGWLTGATKKDLATFHHVIARELGGRSLKRTITLGL